MEGGLGQEHKGRLEAGKQEEGMRAEKCSWKKEATCLEAESS